MPQKISNNVYNTWHRLDDIKINDRGQVIWYLHDGQDYKTYYWDAGVGGLPTLLSTNEYLEANPQFNALGQVIWSRLDGSDKDIFLAEVEVRYAFTSHFCQRRLLHRLRLRLHLAKATIPARLGPTSDESGQPCTYEITGIGPQIDYLDSRVGQVYVDSYYDAETNKFFDPVHKGTFVGDAYLGSELDYIVKNGVSCYKFGQDYEADAGDKYAFKYSYGNGDYYLGYVYQSPGGTYYPGYKFTTMKNELGLTGYYQILSMTYTGDTAKYQQVFVDKYHDGESNKNFTPVHQGQPVGKTSLGSELDYICVDKVLAYRFGIYKGVFYEADVGDRYAFKYSYGNGDYYQGYVYRSPGSVYYPGYKFTTDNKTKLTSTYQILSMTYTGDTAKYKQVFVTKYYDGDQTKKSFKPLNSTAPMGTTYLKSELGYIKNADVSVYRFGRGTTRPTPATPTPSAIL